MYILISFTPFQWNGEERNAYREKRCMNGMEWQEAGSVPVCIAPFNTNVVKYGRGVKPSENGSRTGLT